MASRPSRRSASDLKFLKTKPGLNLVGLASFGGWKKFSKDKHHAQ
jgi:hypothetical protein